MIPDKKRESKMGTRFKRWIVLGCLMAAALATGATQALGSSTSTTPAETTEEAHATAPEPFASYQASTGATIADSTIQGVATIEATLATDADPSSLTAVDTTYAAAVHALDPTAELSKTPSAGEASYYGSSVVLVTMRGQFTLHVSVPLGSPEPHGPVLTLVLDAHTGHIDVRAIEEEVPAAVASLGASRRLG
jgi:hypothetical protein